jgi:crotonobetainyl-CoA:carnitine CoA-transferase CaiB-like acyl-CoA transferase
MKSPLAGIRIVDLTRVLSGPFATQQLIDLGADVIKIEHPEGGDDTRRFGPPFVHGESTYFMSINRGKRSAAIDLKHPRGKELVLALIQRADVVVENFKPGTAERLGFGRRTLHAMKPKLITCSISGYGTGGDLEFEGRAGYDAVIQAASGMMALTGEPDGEPMKVGVAISDMVAGLYAAQGILAALVERERHGNGSHIEVSMLDATCSLLTYQAGIYFATHQSPKRMGNAHPSICPYETIEAKDGLYTLAVGNDDQFSRLVHLIELPWLAEDERFSTNAKRVEHRAALLAVLAPKFHEKTRKEWDDLLESKAIPGGPVLTVPQAIEHPQMRARASVLEHAHPVAGKVRTIASPVRLDDQPPQSVSPPPLLGQHTREILAQELGLNIEEIEQLLTAGAVSDQSPRP